MTHPTAGYVLIACDKFKGSLTGEQVADHLSAGLLLESPGLDVRRVPVADGGEGTLAAAVAAGFGHVPVTCTGPTGEPVDSGYARKGDKAVLEMADACGLSRLPGPLSELPRVDPRTVARTASSRGLGEMIAAALDAGVTRLVVGIGGSASTDGGVGMLTALGARFFDAAGRPLRPGGVALNELAEVDLSGLHPGLGTAEVEVASDVSNPLLGPHGSAAVFAAQKGAEPADVAALESGLSRLAEVTATVTGRDRTTQPGAGAAGGVGWALLAILAARIRPGVELVLDLSRFADIVAGARLVITGEGSVDGQTLQGKAPIGVARAAREARVPVVTVCGRCLLSAAEVRDAGLGVAYPLIDLEPDPRRSMPHAAALLRLVGRQIARELLS
ncbi:MAG TPA: glycerate kinase [Dermatophilaceae bacterium]|nr:glycerate kinase [Dermatophilaceae bacterium]